jgi:hypothetical protein
MSGWEMFFFVMSVVVPLALIVALAWRHQWKRDPKKFKDGFRQGPNAGGPDAFRQGPNAGGPNHWRR